MIYSLHLSFLFWIGSRSTKFGQFEPALCNQNAVFESGFATADSDSENSSQCLQFLVKRTNFVCCFDQLRQPVLITEFPLTLLSGSEVLEFHSHILNCPIFILLCFFNKLSHFFIVLTIVQLFHFHISAVLPKVFLIIFKIN